MLEVLLTREDANTEFALLADWLCADGARVEAGEPVCVIETSKATVEVEAPGAGALVHLFPVGAEVALGGAVGLIAESEAEIAEARGRVRSATSAPADDERRATRKARELAALHGVELASIEKRGFITASDVEERIGTAARAAPTSAGEEAGLLAGIDTEHVSLPRSWFDDPSRGRLDPSFLEQLRNAPQGLVALSSDEKCELYRQHGAEIGEGVTLGEGTVLSAERLVLGDGVALGSGSLVECAEAFCVGELTHVGADLELKCRQALLGPNIHGGRSVRIGGGGHRDPWALVAIGERAFLGDEVFINACRPVLIGRDTFITQRSMIVTHNIGHSILEGFENRFAPVVVEDRAQVGLGAVIYAGCRIGERAIVASNSYVVSDVPAGKLAIGVPARAAGDVQIKLSDSRRVELAHQLLDELYELLALRGHDVRWETDSAARCLRVESDTASGTVALLEQLADGAELPPAAGESVALTLAYGASTVPSGWVVLDLMAREIHGEGGVLLASVREFCRKRGIRFGARPWRYSGGLV